MKIIKITTLVLLLLSNKTFSDVIKIPEPYKFNYLNHEDNKNKIKKTLENIGKSNGASNDAINDIKIRPLENSGLYEYDSGNGNVFYITSDGKYIIKGTALEINSDGFSMVEKQNQSLKNQNLIYAIDKNYLISYGNNLNQHSKTDIFVLTDYTCPFCKKFHEKTLPELIKNNINVHYIPFARNPNNKKALINFEKIFCKSKTNDEKKKMLDYAFENNMNDLNLNDCKSDSYFGIVALSEMFDAIGTPTIMTSSGVNLGGYQEAETLLRKLK